MSFDYEGEAWKYSQPMQAGRRAFTVTGARDFARAAAAAELETFLAGEVKSWHEAWADTEPQDAGALSEEGQLIAIRASGQMVRYMAQALTERGLARAAALRGDSHE